MQVIDDVLFFFSLLVCMALGSSYKKIDDLEMKRNYGAGLGLLATCLICGPLIYHSLLVVWGNVIIIKCCDRRYSHQLSLVYSWTYLVYLFFNPNVSVYVLWLHQTIALRLVGLATELHLDDKAKTTPSSKTSLQHYDTTNIMSEPTAVDIITYSYFFIGLHKGPYYRWKIFEDHFTAPFGVLGDCRVITEHKLKKALVCCFGYLLLRIKYNPNAPKKHKFFPYSIRSRVVIRRLRLMEGAKKALLKLGKLTPTQPKDSNLFTKEIMRQQNRIFKNSSSPCMRSCPSVTVNECRKYLFTKKDRQLENIPPTEAALKQHTLRSVFRGIHVWGQCLIYYEEYFYSTFGSETRYLYSLPQLIMFFLEQQLVMLLCTCVFTETGFGVYPAKCAPIPGHGPTLAPSLLKLASTATDVALKQEYNFAMLKCFYNERIIFGPKMRQTLRGWDMATRFWFNAYIYRQVKSNKEIRSACAFAAWWVWSGSSLPRLMMVATLWVYEQIEDEYTQLCNSIDSSTIPWNLGFSLMRIFCLLYLTPCLIVSDTFTALRYYNSIYWSYHLLMLFLIITLVVIIKMRSRRTYAGVLAAN